MSGIEDLKVGGQLTQATWFRLLIPSLIPQIEKLLYLDADTLLLGPVDSLYAVDVSKFAAAAVQDPIGGKHFKQLGLETETQYFNAGVLLMNLDFFEGTLFLKNALHSPGKILHC